MKKNVLLFACSAEEIGWDDSLAPVRELRLETDLLHQAIVADLAERFSEQHGVCVVLFETTDSHIEVLPPLPARVERKAQKPGPLQKRIQEGVKEVMEATDHSSAVVFLGRNPLYPVQLVIRGFELLGQEDNVIVLGEAIREGQVPSLMWLSLKNYHPEIFEQNERWWQGGAGLLQAAADAQSLVMTVRPVRDIASRHDFGYLFHEIEREVLLKQWYPMRTYEALHRMRRKHLIPGTPE